MHPLAGIDYWSRISASFWAWSEPVRALPWERVRNAPMGLQFFCALLGLSVLLVGFAAFGCIWRKLDDPKPPTGPLAEWPAPKKRYGMKTIILVLITLLPGGLVGSATILALLGRENWRRDAEYILAYSIIPTLGLLWLGTRLTPLSVPPGIATVQYELELFCGLTAAFMHFWIMLKCLKQYWGEPDDRIPWWPPLVWWSQLLLFGGVSYYLLGTLL